MWRGILIFRRLGDFEHFLVTYFFAAVFGGVVFFRILSAGILPMSKNGFQKLSAGDISK